MGIKERIKDNPSSYRIFFSIYNRFFGKNRCKGKRGNRIVTDSALLKRTNISIDGKGNTIEIGSLTKLTDTKIYIKGNNNRIVIGQQNGFAGSSLWIEDDGNAILIGKHNRFFEGCHLAAIEGTSIIVGENGLFAPEVQFRTGDSHSILDMDGKRINPSKDINIGNHVWAGARSAILKGSVVPDDCVIGMSSLVNKSFSEKNCVYAGNPAAKVKSGINWQSERV